MPKKPDWADGAKIDSLLRKVGGSKLIGKLRPGVNVLYERTDGEVCQCKFVGIRPMVGLIDDVDLPELVLELPGGKTLALMNALKISLAPEVFNPAEKVAEKPAVKKVLRAMQNSGTIGVVASNLTSIGVTEMAKEKSYEELMQEIADLQKQASSVLAAQRKEALGEARALVAKFGFSARELGIGESGGSAAGEGKKQASKEKPEPKFAHPENSALTWSGGRGQKPAWLKKFLEDGRSIDELKPL